MEALTVGIPLLLIAGSMATLLWLVYVQRAEANYHARLVRSVRISSDAFEDGGSIPVEFSCEGEGISPPLRWSNLPEDTQSLALLATDADLPSSRFKLFQIVHWVVYNIPKDVVEFAPGITDADLSAAGIAVGRNWSREAAYYPPCPVFGGHRYVFRLYALDVDAIQPKTNDRKGVLEAMEDHILAYGELSGFYEK